MTRQLRLEVTPMHGAKNVKRVVLVFEKPGFALVRIYTKESMPNLLSSAGGVDVLALDSYTRISNVERGMDLAGVYPRPYQIDLVYLREDECLLFDEREIYPVEE